MNAASEKMNKIDEIIETVNNSEISSIKQTVTRIINIINDPDSNTKDLRNIIETDPPLTTELLKLANSAFYGFPRTINEIREAIVCIGFETVRELALNQKVCELFRKDEDINGYSRKSLWKHSVAVALCGKIIFRREFRERGENIYAAGLLHDIGIIILDQFLHEIFVDILEISISEKNNLFNVESAALNYNHTDIGKVLTENWNFPDEIVNAIAYHHEPDNAGDEYAKISSVIFIADYIVQNYNIGFCEAPYGDKALFQKCLTKLNIKEKAINLIAKELREEIIKMEKADWF